MLDPYHYNSMKLECNELKKYSFTFEIKSKTKHKFKRTDCNSIQYCPIFNICHSALFKTKLNAA